MNKFRNNLHAAFFDENLDTPKKLDVLETQEVERELEKLQQPILDDFKKSEEKILSDISSGREITSRYDQTQQQELREDSRRFSKRVIENKKVWNKKITEGFGGLIQALKNDGYFKDKLEGEKLEKEIDRIKELYWKEVKEQYIKNVWFGEKDDEKFNGTKNRLFDIDVPNSPAEKIYCELTGAATISRVSRTYLEGYEAEILDWEDTQKPNEKKDEMSDRENRNFLGDALPEYLRNIRKTPGALKVLRWLPIFNLKEDRPSKVDRKAIKHFLKYSSKITLTNNNTKDKAVALMEALHDSRLNTNNGENTYQEVLRDHNITVDKKYLDDIIKAGNFYIKTQDKNNPDRDQHAIYLSVLKIIESKGSVTKAVEDFKKIVEQGKIDKKAEKEGYEDGVKLKGKNQEVYDFAKDLGITDFTSATRLVLDRGRDNTKYFANPAEKILANLNNDRVISAGEVDSEGYKTGAQFLEALKQVGAEIGDKEEIDEITGEKRIITGSDRALNNLLERAKLKNKKLKNPLDEKNITKERINQGDYKLILLLQNIISDPGEDLYTLLLGKGPLEGIDLEKKEKEGELEEKNFKDALKKAGEMLNEKGFIKEYEELFKGKNVEIQNFADLQASLASCLYDNYKLGLGAGGTLSFNEWAKGLKIGAGAQVRGDGTVLGMSISYDHDFDLGKGWTLTPGLSAGIFLPIVSGGEDVFASAGLHVTADKKKINLDTGTARHYGLDAGYNVLTNTAYLGWHDEWNKAEGVEVAAKFQSEKFKKTIMWKLLDDIKATAGDGKLDLSNRKVREAIEKLVNEQKDIEKEARKTVVDGMLTMLEPYNNVNLNQKGVKYAIAEGVAQKYGRQWAERTKKAISQKAYRSGYSVGVFWVVGTTKAGVYAQAYLTKHYVDGGADHDITTYEIAQEHEGELNQEILDKYNSKLGLSEDNKMKLDNKGFVVIPKSIAHRVNVNVKMKGLMKKDDKGNILIDKNTPMATDTDILAVRKGGELTIGGRGGEKDIVKLDTLLDASRKEWFTDGNINQNEVLNLSAKECDLDDLNKAINDLNEKIPRSPIQHLSPDAQTVELINKINEINKNNKRAELTITNKNGKVEFELPPVEGDDGRGVELKYKSNFEMIDSDAKKIANDVYAEALNVQNPKVLNEVKHKPRTKWTEFETAYNTLVKNGLGENNENEKTVKEKVRNIFKELDKQISGAKFSETLDKDQKFEGLTGDALVQALMSIKNIFARSKQVRGGKENYEFKRPNGKDEKEMRDIIKERYGILKTLKDKVKDKDAQGRYEKLFKATADYVNDKKFAVKSAQAAHLGNTVGFNLGDKNTPENPLFNPEIYDQMVNLDDLEKKGFSSDARKGLHERAMSLFAKNPALINPVLQSIGIDTSNLKPKDLEDIVNKGTMTINDKTKKCELVLDINGKNYTISSGMKFGFFTQCVNHTIILDEISIADEDGTSVPFKTVRENDSVNEGDYGSIVATTNLSLGIAVAGGGGNGGDNKVKTEGKYKDTGKLSSTNTQTNGQNDKGTGGTGAGIGQNTSNSLGGF